MGTSNPASLAGTHLAPRTPPYVVMYTVEQARGGVVHTPGFTANGPSPPGAHLGHSMGHITDTARGPHPGTSHTPAIQPRRPRLRTHGSCARALWRERTRSALTFARVAQKLNRIGALSVGQLFTLRRRPFCDTCSDLRSGRV